MHVHVYTHSYRYRHAQTRTCEIGHTILNKYELTTRTNNTCKNINNKILNKLKPIKCYISLSYYAVKPVRGRPPGLKATKIGGSWLTSSSLQIVIAKPALNDRPSRFRGHLAMGSLSS